MTIRHVLIYFNERVGMELMVSRNFKIMFNHQWNSFFGDGNNRMELKDSDLSVEGEKVY